MVFLRGSSGLYHCQLAGISEDIVLVVQPTVGRRWGRSFVVKANVVEVGCVGDAVGNGWLSWDGRSLVHALVVARVF